GFAPRSVGTGFRELAESLTQCNDRDAPHFGAAKHGGFFTWSKVEPEFLDELLAVGVTGPRGCKRRKVLRGMRAGVTTCVNNDIGQSMEGRAHRAGCQRASRELRGEKLEDQALGKAEKIRLRAFAFPRRVL